MSNFNRTRDRAEPKYKGLRNRGSTCYLNSVLQVLFMTKEFRDAVQRENCKNYHTNYIDAQLKSLFNGLKTGSPTTEDIIQRLGIENVRKQHDAAEYFEKMLSLASPEASKVFHGRLIHRTSCSCHVSTERNSFWTLNLPINNTHNGVYNVEDGLKRFFRKSELTGVNQVYCDECEAKRDTTTECEVELYPKVLVLLLKRFEFSYSEVDYVKNDCPVDVPLNIEMPKGVSYELYSTVDHVGDLRGGHYTATIQSPNDGWYDFNDSRVTPINNFNPEKSQKGYLLFYRKTQMSDSPQENHHGSSVHPAESKTNRNNADDGYADQDMDDDVLINTSSSSSRPMDKRPMSAGRGDGTGGDDVMEWGGDDRAGDMVGAGDPQPMEIERLDRKGGERRTTNPARLLLYRVITSLITKFTCETNRCPMVSDPEGGVIERRRGQREPTGLLEVCEEGEKEGRVIQKKHREVFDNPNRFSLRGIRLWFRQSVNREGEIRLTLSKERKSIKKGRKKKFFMCFV